MGRSESPLDPAEGPLAAFAIGLRELRQEGGGRSYRELARKAHFSASTLSIAAGGRAFPTLPVVQGFVRACGGDVAEWTRRWTDLDRALNESGTAPIPRTAALDGSAQVLEPHDVLVAGRHNGGPAPTRLESTPEGEGQAAGRSERVGNRMRVRRARLQTARRRRRIVLVLATTAAGVAASVAVLADGGSGSPAASGLSPTPVGKPSRTAAAGTGTGPATAAPGTEVIVGPGCPQVQGTSSVAFNGADTWTEVGGGPVECTGHALAAYTTTSTTLTHSSYTWTMRTVAARCAIQIYIADVNPSSATAHYQVYGASGLLDGFQIDQAGGKGRWVAAGTWNAPGGLVKLVLTDRADYPGAHHHVTASAASFTCT